MAGTFSYFQVHTYRGPGPHDEIALANKIAGRQASRFAVWAQVNFPAPKEGAESGVAA
ncbi:hypothetical protein MES5069_30206 [Mesorhizobium escarrei]|uniref:Uncharacterized protein n=1 Tax=Mesorhizobium escarrei TaxID=666018 RepID=A0ABN8JW88_9HYPH|nr:hypothetical protein MES5069_30206 [Mesorhizobium escarrei]